MQAFELDTLLLWNKVPSISVKFDNLARQRAEELRRDEGSIEVKQVLGYDTRGMVQTRRWSQGGSVRGRMSDARIKCLLIRAYFMWLWPVGKPYGLLD